MTNSQRLNVVRGILRTWFHQRYGEESIAMSESILIRDGFFCGRRFRADDFSAVWFAEENQIKMYDPAGRLIDAIMIDSFGESEMRRAA